MNAASDTVENLIVDLLEWLTAKDRTYEETMNAWRTSCPRLPVWEDANERQLIRCERGMGTPLVRVTPLGYEMLSRRKSSEAAIPSVVGDFSKAARPQPRGDRDPDLSCRE